MVSHCEMILIMGVIGGYMAKSKYFSLRVGDRFENWTVNGIPVSDKKGNYKVECICNCGTVQLVSAYNLTRKLSKQCRHCARGSNDTVESLSNRTYRSSRCPQEKPTYNIDSNYLSESFSLQNNTCALTGVDITPQESSVVRVSNTIGYEPANTLIVSKDVASVVNSSGLDVNSFVNLCQTVTSTTAENPVMDFLARRDNE